MKNYKFLPSHEWFNADENTIGISNYAQEQLGDIVFVELPEVGDTVEKGTAFANIESVKAVSEIFSPVSGEVVEINEELLDNPEKINEDAFGSWMIKIKDAEGKESLLSEDEYKKFLETIEE